MVQILVPQPEAVIKHLLQRVNEREITMNNLIELQVWIKAKPEVDSREWYKRFKTFVLCGSGQLVKTVLAGGQAPAKGKEIF